MKKLLLMLLATVAVLTGCKKESQDFYSRGFKLTRADISGAEYLTITNGSDGTKAGDEGSSTLFKIDDKGNMTGVMFYAESFYDEDGNKTGEVNVSTDISICPKYITDYGEKYLLFTYCDIRPVNAKYLTAEGWHTSEFHRALYDSGYTSSNHFLIRKTDGAIFKINDEDIYKFPNPGEVSGEAFSDIELHHKLQYNTTGDLYMADRVLSKLKLKNDKMLLQTLTQPGISVDYLMLDKHSNVYTNDDSYAYLEYSRLPVGSNLYFANGSVMEINIGKYNDVVTLIDNEFYGVKYEEIGWYTYQLSLLKLPTQLPANPSNPNLDVIATIKTNKERNHNSGWLDGIYDSPTQTVIFGFWVYDKATKSLSERDFPEEFVISNTSGSDNGYNQDGIAYQMQNNNTQIAKYNIVDLTKEVIMCDRGAVPPFVVSKSKQTSTEFIEQGIKSSNGAPIRVHTELATGRVTVFEDPDKRTITELIKVS